MELVLLGLVPFVFLLVAASMLVVNQLSSFLQFSRFSTRERRNSGIIRGFIARMAMAQGQLACRSRELEVLSARLRLNNEELTRLNGMKTKFLSMAVHDVRSPLAAVKGFSELLGRSPGLDSQARHYASNISRAYEQINRLLGDLTDLALIEAGKYKLEPSSFDLNDVVGDIAPAASFAAQQKGVQLAVGEVPAGTVLTADRFRLGRVLQNLLGNAVKFTPAGGRVELRMRMTGGWVTFYVKDTGPGIHPSERAKIFQKFYQSAYMKDAKAKAAGWGLGLAISEEIARGHGGQIGVESAGTGKGATFWVRVPLKPSRRGAASLARSAAAGLFLLLAGVPAVSAQNLPLEDKAKYETALEKRVEGVLLRMLGPNRYKVVVEATVDFTRIERFESKEGTTTARSERSMPYLWGDVRDASGAASAELLPGVPAIEPGGMGGIIQAGGRPQNYERRNSFASDFLKRLAVTVILDSSVDAKQTEDVRAIVTEILDIAPIRGDTVTVVKSPFMPLWKTIWQEPEMAGVTAKYLLISLLSLMTLVVVAMSLLKLSGAMSEMALAQKTTLSMDMNPGGGIAGEGFDAPPALEGDRLQPAVALSGPGGETAAPGSGAPDAVRFTVRPDQVEVLADMMSGEDPANVSLVVGRVEPHIRAMLLAALPPKAREAVFVNLGRVRYVEPDLILNLKEELERRLAGSVGGLTTLAAMLEEANLSERKPMLDAIAARDPGLGQRLRRRVFLMESLANLTRDEWSLVQSHVSHEDWALALAEGPAMVADALLANAPERARKIMAQMIASRPGDGASRRAAQDKIARSVAVLTSEGKLAELAGREPKELGMSAEEESHGR